MLSRLVGFLSILHKKSILNKTKIFKKFNSYLLLDISIFVVLCIVLLTDIWTCTVMKKRISCCT